jgi:hypothetical protein
MAGRVYNRPTGYYTVSGPDGTVTGETRSCCHCQQTWVYARGSGRVRGHCLGCHGDTCGRPECGPCVPAEVRLDNLEAGRPELTPPKLIVPGGWDG